MKAKAGQPQTWIWYVLSIGNIHSWFVAQLIKAYEVEKDSCKNCVFLNKTGDLSYK